MHDDPTIPGYLLIGTSQILSGIGVLLVLAWGLIKSSTKKHIQDFEKKMDALGKRDEQLLIELEKLEGHVAFLRNRLDDKYGDRINVAEQKIQRLEAIVDRRKMT